MNTNFFKKQMDALACTSAAPSDLDVILCEIISNNGSATELMSKIQGLNDRLYGSEPKADKRDEQSPLDGKINIIKYHLINQRDLLTRCHALLNNINNKL